MLFERPPGKTQETGCFGRAKVSRRQAGVRIGHGRGSLCSKRAREIGGALEVTMAEQTSEGGCRRSGGKCSAPRAGAVTLHNDRQKWTSSSEPRADEPHDIWISSRLVPGLFETLRLGPRLPTATRTRSIRHTTELNGTLHIPDSDWHLSSHAGLSSTSGRPANSRTADSREPACHRARRSSCRAKPTTMPWTNNPEGVQTVCAGSANNRFSIRAPPLRSRKHARGSCDPTATSSDGWCSLKSTFERSA